MKFLPFLLPFLLVITIGDEAMHSNQCCFKYFLRICLNLVPLYLLHVEICETCIYLFVFFIHIDFSYVIHIDFRICINMEKIFLMKY